MPFAEDVLSAFVAMLAIKGLGYSSTRMYLSAIHHYHMKESYGNPGIANLSRFENVRRVLVEMVLFCQRNPRERDNRLRLQF